MFMFLFFSVRLLHLSLWTATQKTLHISLPGDPGQIDQEVTEVDSNAGKSNFFRLPKYSFFIFVN